MDISKQLDELRAMIDNLDETIVSFIARRQQMSQLIGRIKDTAQLAIYDEKRENALEDYHRQLSVKYAVDESMILEIFALIIQQSRAIQSK